MLEDVEGINEDEEMSKGERKMGGGNKDKDIDKIEKKKIKK